MAVHKTKVATMAVQKMVKRSYIFTFLLSNTLIAPFKRLFLFRKKPAQVLFETTLDKIERLSTDVEERLSDGKQATILLLKTDDEDNRFERLRREEINLLKSKLEERIRNPSLTC